MLYLIFVVAFLKTLRNIAMLFEDTNWGKNIPFLKIICEKYKILSIPSSREILTEEEAAAFPSHQQQRISEYARFKNGRVDDVFLPSHNYKYADKKQQFFVYSTGDKAHRLAETQYFFASAVPPNTVQVASSVPANTHRACEPQPLQPQFTCAAQQP